MLTPCSLNFIGLERLFRRGSQGIGAGSLQAYWTDDKWIAILPDLKKLTYRSNEPCPRRLTRVCSKNAKYS